MHKGDEQFRGHGADSLAGCRDRSQDFERKGQRLSAQSRSLKAKVCHWKIYTLAVGIFVYGALGTTVSSHAETLNFVCKGPEAGLESFRLTVDLDNRIATVVPNLGLCDESVAGATVVLVQVMGNLVSGTARCGVNIKLDRSAGRLSVWGGGWNGAPHFGCERE